MLVTAWDAVTTKTVLNGFLKSTISSECQKAIRAEDEIYVQFSRILF